MKVQAVIVAKLDRLTRSVKDLRVPGAVRAPMLALVSVAESLDTSSARGAACTTRILSFPFVATHDQLENLKRLSDCSILSKSPLLDCPLSAFFCTSSS